MKLFNYELTEWHHSTNGLFKYNMDYKNNPIIAIGLYHNLVDKSFCHPIGNLMLTETMIYDPSKRILWSVLFYNSIQFLNDLYYNLYEPTETTEEEIKNNVDNFIIRVNKLIVFS